MKFLGSKSIVNDFVLELLPGIYRGILVRVVGDNEAAQDSVPADLNWVVSVNGRRVQSWNGAFLNELNKQEFGYPEYASVTGGAFSYIYYIPFEFKGFRNGLLVDDDNIVTVALERASTAATTITSGTARFIGMETNAANTYLGKVFSYNQSVVAGTFAETIPHINVSDIWLKSTVVDNVKLEKDGMSVVNADYNEILAMTSLTKRTEAALLSYPHIQLGDSVNDVQSKHLGIEFVGSGAGTLEIYTLSFESSGSALQRSQTVISANQRRRNAIVTPGNPDQSNLVSRIAAQARTATVVREAA